MKVLAYIVWLLIFCLWAVPAGRWLAAALVPPAAQMELKQCTSIRC